MSCSILCYECLCLVLILCVAEPTLRYYMDTIQYAFLLTAFRYMLSVVFLGRQGACRISCGGQLLRNLYSVSYKNNSPGRMRTVTPENQYERYELMELKWSCLKENACFQGMRQDASSYTRKPVWEVWANAELCTVKLFKGEHLKSMRQSLDIRKPVWEVWTNAKLQWSCLKENALKAGCVQSPQKTSMRGMN